MKENTGIVLAFDTDIGVISLSVEFRPKALAFYSALSTHQINSCVMEKFTNCLVHEIL
jgi:hypothetical protein